MLSRTMRTNLQHFIHILIAIALLSGCSRDGSKGGTEEGQKRREVELILLSGDRITEDSRARWEDLKKRKEEVLPILLSIARESGDSILVGNALNLMRESGMEYDQLITEIVEVLDRDIKDRRNAVEIKFVALNLIGLVGNERDCRLVYPFLRSKEKDIVLVSLHVLGQIGGEDAIGKIRSFMAKRAKSMGKAEIEKDWIMINAKRIVGEMQNRLDGASGARRQKKAR